MAIYNNMLSFILLYIGIGLNVLVEEYFLIPFPFRLNWIQNFELKLNFVRLFHIDTRHLPT